MSGVGADRARVAIVTLLKETIVTIVSLNQTDVPDQASSPPC